jgi:hypothetical protein
MTYRATHARILAVVTLVGGGTRADPGSKDAMTSEEIARFLNANIGKKLKLTFADSEPEVVLLLSTDDEGFQGYLIGDDPPTRQWWQTDWVADVQLMGDSNGGAQADLPAVRKYFDFGSATIRRLEAATIDMERWSVRADAGIKVFEAAAIRAGLEVLHNGDHVTLPEGPCLIVGVATWSDPDMIALDSAVDRIHQRNIPTWVFDIDECRTVAHIQTMMPQVDMQPRKPPVFGYYVDGKLQTFGEGQDAVRWLEQL